MRCSGLIFSYFPTGFNFSYRRPQKTKAAPTVSVPSAVPAPHPAQQPHSRLPAVQRPVQPQQPIGFSRPGFSQQPAQQPGSALVRPPAQQSQATPAGSQLPNKPPATAAPVRAQPAVTVPQGKAAANGPNGAAAHAKSDAIKPARERTPQVAHPQRPSENGTKDEAAQQQRKPRGARDTASPAVGVNGSASAAQSNGSQGQVAASKDGEDKPSAGQPREPREPREKRPRGGKNKEDKTKADGSAAKGDAADATKPTVAAAVDGDKADDKPSPSATPRPPVFALYCKGLPNGTTEDDLRGLFAADVKSTVGVETSRYAVAR